MKRILPFFLLLISATGQAAADPARCPIPAPNEPVVYSDDYKTLYDPAEMAEAFRKTYESGARLRNRAYYDAALGSYVLPHRTGLVRIDETFLRSVTRHVEIALERKYAEYIFMPDMGHSHLHIPTEDYDRLKAIEPISKMYETFFSYRRLQMLYHTAEKLKVREGRIGNGAFPQDPTLLWRYFSRNPVGDNNGGENVAIYFQGKEPQRYNTVKDIPGHREYSAGFDIHATKNGCFPYQHDGKTYYFDLSLDPLPCRNCAF